VGYLGGGPSGPPLEKQIPFGFAQGRLSRQKKGAQNDKVEMARRHCQTMLSFTELDELELSVSC
jgi:hypothetical protein